jgi:branched-chain amino acid transport system permease protein
MTTVWVGLALGSIYVIVATGYNIGLTVTGVLNFAQAQFLMVGTFLAYWVVVTLGWSTLVFIPIGMGILALVGALEERIAIRPLQGRGAHGELVTTVGFATLLEGIVVLVWGEDPLRVPFFGPTETIDVLGATVRPVDIATIAATVALVVAFHFWTRRTRLGLASLAAAEDREAAQLRGINVQRLATGSFAAAAALGALFAPLIAPQTFAVVTVAAALAVKGFVALVIGGFGSQFGVLIGGMVVGLTEALTARWFGSEYSLIAVFGVLLAVLLLRPQGLFGERTGRIV